MYTHNTQYFFVYVQNLHNNIDITFFPIIVFVTLAKVYLQPRYTVQKTLNNNSKN